MRFTTKTAAQSEELKVKFYFDEEAKDSGVELKFITDEERQNAQHLLVKEDIDFPVHPDTKKLIKVVTPKFEVEELEAWFLDTLIASWWGMWLDDEEVKCTKENKVKLYKEQEVFRDFIDEKHNKLKQLVVESYGSSSNEKN